MESTIEGMTMYMCQRSKEVVRRNKKKYFDFVSRILNDDETEKGMNALLPFDNFINAQLRIVDSSSQIRSMGISIMRMDLDPATFSIGVSLEIEGGKYNNKVNPTEFIIGCQSLEQIRENIKTTEYTLLVQDTFDQLIENCYFPSYNNKG